MNYSYKFLTFTFFTLLFLQPVNAETSLTQFCKSDCKTEYNFLRKYSEQGSSLADFAMAIMLYQGEGVEKNITKANRHLMRAAKKGEPGAQYQLAFFYEHGLFKPQNIKQARKWYYLAGRQHTLDAKEKVKQLDGYIKSDAYKASETKTEAQNESSIVIDMEKIERISISFQADYRQILKAAKIQTCNANCEPYWDSILAPILKLKS